MVSTGRNGFPKYRLQSKKFRYTLCSGLISTPKEVGPLASTAPKQSETTANLIAAVSHPIRQRAMTILAARVASPSDIAQEINLESNLDLSPGNVSYHVRALEKAGLVELVKTAQVRGATEHFYRGAQRAMLFTPEWEELPLLERQKWSERAWSIVIHDAARALDAGTFDLRTDRFFTHTPLNLDEEGWRALSEMHDEMLQRSFDIQAESDERRQKSNEAAIRTIAIMVTFEAAPSSK